ncbi:hypothetical protein PHMEG_00014753 [Phytophthora megakarya]|uniref:Reverse transcriptase n=1 Tax=Phytophthora megakarya TaxID=4795 RepID=A0A225W307_9STRA|nr:hypothetical protein PHMEG_00014753 [Phytophthora megakarya]
MDSRRDLYKRSFGVFEHISPRWISPTGTIILMLALNVSFDVTRLNTPFYLADGWDARSTVSAMLGPKPSSVPERNAYERRRKLQREYSYALACAEDVQKKAEDALGRTNSKVRAKAGFEKGDSVWLYIPKVQTGLSR